MNRSIHLLALAALLALGCPADDDPDDGVGEDSSSAATPTDDSSTAAADSGSTTGPDIDALFECSEPISDARPLSGPGYDPATGLLEPVQDSYVVSTTQILPRPEATQDFFALVAEVTADLEQRDGMVAYALGFEPACGFARTIAVWRDEAAMLAFAAGDVHRSAVARTYEVGVTGRVTHFTVSADEMPVTWDVAAAHVAEIAPFY